MSKPSLSPEQLEQLADDGTDWAEILKQLGTTREQIADRISMFDQAQMPKDFPDLDLVAAYIVGELKLPSGRPTGSTNKGDLQYRLHAAAQIYHERMDAARQNGMAYGQSNTILMEVASLKEFNLSPESLRDFLRRKGRRKPHI